MPSFRYPSNHKAFNLRLTLLLLGFFTFNLIDLQGQSGSLTPVTGKVVGNQGEVIPYATIAILDQDSMPVDGTTTGEDGTFSLEVAPGIYDLKVFMISYNDTILEGITIGQSAYHLGTIILISSAQTLEQVEVESNRTQMELKLDKRVFNVADNLSAIGSNASDILDDLPSVTVDVEGNVSLRGSGNVIILVNGKPSGLVESGDPQSLRQLQGDMIERIEVITNPSARYDAEGEVGIINIVLKKEEKGGLNGSFDVSTGWPHDHGVALNLNYRKDWINFFISEGISWDRGPGGGFSDQEFMLEDTSFAFRRDVDELDGDFSNTVRLGTDIYFNEKTILTFAGTYQYSNGFRDHTRIYKDLNAQDEVMQTITRTQDESEIEHELEFDALFEKEFKKEDQKLTLDFRYSQQEDTEEADYRESSDQPNAETLIQRSFNGEDEIRFQFRGDYVHPFGNEGKFETGLNLTFRDIDNEFQVEEQVGQEWEVLPEFDNNFRYLENIYAAYAMIGEKFGRFSLQGGLRSEYSDISTRLIKTNEENYQDYINFFPSVFTGYEINENNTFQASYSRRISRPGFWDLIPFRNYGDNRVIHIGNINLRPEYTNSYELAYLRYLPAGSILSSLYYRDREGVIEDIRYVDSTGITRIVAQNLAQEDNFGLEFNINYNLTDWWSANGNFNFYRAITNGEYEGRDLFRDTYTWTARASTKATIAKLIEVQLSGRYRAPQETTQGRRLAIATMDFGASMDVLNGNGTLTFSIRDVFNSRVYRMEVIQDDFTSYTEHRRRVRQFRLSFNYRLNRKKEEARGGDDFGGM